MRVLLLLMCTACGPTHGTGSGGHAGSSSGAPSSSFRGASSRVTQPPLVPCGTITAQGQCQEQVLTFCDPGTNLLQVVDCGTDFSPGTPAQCAQISASYGFDCVLPVGASCALPMAVDVMPRRLAAAFCGGAGAGCVGELGQPSRCLENVGACSGGAQCLGNRAVVECHHGQAVALDCGSLPCVDGACRGGPGHACSEATEAVMRCQAGVTCVDGACTAF